MSVIEVKSYPATHIVVRNFLDSSSKKKLLNSLLPIRENHLKKLSHLPARADYRILGDDKHQQTRVFSEHLGRKKVSWIYDLSKRNPTLKRDCVEILENNMWRDDLRQAYEDINNGIYSSNHTSGTKKPEIKIRRLLECEPRDWFFSQYETGDWLTWHNDTYESTCSYTAGYIFQFDDRQFLGGGDFLLSEVSKTNNPPTEKIVTYPHEDNFLIIYPANALHKVTKVIGYRYSLLYLVEYQE